MKYLYLLVVFFAILFPLIASFGPRISFWRNWKYLFPSILLTMTVFIPWDIAKTAHGVWGFNPDYLIGFYIFNLPIEEWLFFIAIPYACVYTYEVVRFLIKKDLFLKARKSISYSLIIILLSISFLNLDKTYTAVTFISVAVFLLIHELFLKQNYLSCFYLTYLFCLIPFLLVNGILTGSFIPGEIVWYNNAENLEIRLFTIPVEDVFYGLLLILMNITFYEKLKKIF